MLGGGKGSAFGWGLVEVGLAAYQLVGGVVAYQGGDG
jgi:hypothetical protein